MLNNFSKAVILSARAHDGQIRKGTGLPYIYHPMEVARLVAEFGGSLVQQVAAVLHDVIEDGGDIYIEEIRNEFGSEILQIVLDCTDTAPAGLGKKAPWRIRKQIYTASLAAKPERSLLVVACDKLANARAINEDLRTVGLKVFDRFAGKLEGTIWYYQTLALSLEATGLRPAIALNVEVQEMKRRVDLAAMEQYSGGSEGSASAQNGMLMQKAT